MTKNREESEEDFPFFDVDMGLLHKRWCEHTRWYWKYAGEMHDAEDAYDRAKAEKEVLEEELKRAEAEAQLDVRRNHKKYGFKEKPNEGAIAALVILDEGRKKAIAAVFDCQRKINKRKHLFGMCKRRVHTMDNQRKSLESCQELFVNHYYAEPKVKDGKPVTGLPPKKKKD
jgi:hypothetical protein